MSGNITRICLVGLVGLALAGCSSIPNPLASPAPGPTENDLSAQAATEAEAAASGTVVERPALVYEWDTQYSAFLSPPIEVRR